MWSDGYGCHCSCFPAESDNPRKPVAEVVSRRSKQGETASYSIPVDSALYFPFFVSQLLFTLCMQVASSELRDRETKLGVVFDDDVRLPAIVIIVQWPWHVAELFL